MTEIPLDDSYLSVAPSLFDSISQPKLPRINRNMNLPLFAKPRITFASKVVPESKKLGFERLQTEQPDGMNYFSN